MGEVLLTPNLLKGRRLGIGDSERRRRKVLRGNRRSRYPGSK